MILSPTNKIKLYTDNGWWGTHTLDDILQSARVEVPNRLALVDAPNRKSFTDFAQKKYTYAELGLRVDQIAARFLTDGLKKDDIICTQIPNIVESVIVLLAAFRIGVIVSPIPMQYREHEIDHIVNHTQAVAMVTVARFKDHAPSQMILDMRSTLPSLANIYVFGAEIPDSCSALTLEKTEQVDGSIITKYLANNKAGANDIATICWTSGTEAAPKGVPRSHNHWFSTGRVCSDAGKLIDGDILLNPFPMVNMAAIGSMVYPWLMCRGTLIQHHPFDLKIFLQQIPDEKVNYTIAAPALLNMLLKEEEILKNTDLSSLKCLGSGSAPLSPWMVKGWQDKYGLGVMNFFGANEGTSLFSTMHDIPDPTERAQYFPRFGVKPFKWEAKAASWMKTRLVDPDTEEEITEAGRAGELRITGATIFDGYFRSPTKNKNIFDDQGYFKTGDNFMIAGTGKLERFYKYVGRSKEIIIRGGMNISPAELDGLLDGHPKIKEAATTSYPDEDLGERVCAIVVPHAGQTITLKEINDHLKAKGIAVFKLPEKIVITDSLPRNPMGKVLRRNLLK